MTATVKNKIGLTVPVAAQRRSIGAQLDEAENGPFHGPFNTAEEMIAHMKSQLKKREALKKVKRSR